jgi:hypothetical protein
MATGSSPRKRSANRSFECSIRAIHLNEITIAKVLSIARNLPSHMPLRLKVLRARAFLSKIIRARGHSAQTHITAFCRELGTDDEGYKACLAALSMDDIAEGAAFPWDVLRVVSTEHLKQLPPHQVPGEHLRALSFMRRRPTNCHRLRGALVRFRMPWWDVDCPQYSAALIDAIVEPHFGEPARLTLKLLNADTRGVLGDTWVTTPGYISDAPLTSAELECIDVPCEVGGPSDEMAMRHWYLRHRQGPHPQRAYDRRSALDHKWIVLRGQAPDAEQHGICIKYSRPGVRSYSEWLGVQLCGENGARVQRFMKCESKAACAARVEGMSSAFDAWPADEAQRAREIGRWLYVKQWPEFPAHFAYAERLRTSSSAANFERDDGGPYTAHSVFVEYANKWLDACREAKVTIVDPLAEDQRCSVCFKSSDHGFAGGTAWVCLQPCRHATCRACADKLLDGGRTDCSMGCGPVCAWLVCEHFLS